MVTPISTIKIVKDLQVLLEKASQTLAVTNLKFRFKFSVNLGQVNASVFFTYEIINTTESILYLYVHKNKTKSYIP